MRSSPISVEARGRSARLSKLAGGGLAAVLALALPASGAIVTCTWNNPTSGNWNVDANWTNAPVQGGFPNNGNGGVATYDATISATGPAYTVTLGTSVTVEDLLLNSASATVNQTGGTFIATGGLTIFSGTYQVNGGTISNTAVTAASGSLVFAANSNNVLSGVAVNGDLNLLTVGAVATLAAGTTFTTAHLAGNAASLALSPGQTLSGSILLEGASAGNRFVEMTTAGAFTIGPTGVIRSETGLGSNAAIGGSNYFGGAMALTNQGLVSSRVSGRTITVSGVSLTNSASGILEASNGGLLTVNSTNWSNAGNLRALTGSAANLNGAWSNLGGTITADATSALNLGGSFATGNLGTLALAAGSAVTVSGVWNNTGQTFSFNTATGSWTLNAGTITGGQIGFTNGQTLLFAANSGNLLSGVTINGDLNLNTVGAVTKLAGGTTFAAAHLAGNFTSAAFAPGQTLAATLLFEGPGTGSRTVEMTAAGAFTIGATGVVRTEAGFGGTASIGGSNYFGGAMTLTNQGLISSQVSGRTITVNAASFSNAGTLEAINGGLLSIPAGYAQSAGLTRVDGALSVAANPTLATITLAGGRLEGKGTVTAKVANSATIAPGLSGAGALSIAGDLTLAASSVLQIEIGGLVQSTQYDLLSEAGTAPLTLGGALVVSLINGFQILVQPGDTFTILSSNQPITGTFTNLVGGRVTTADSFGSFVVSTVGNNVILSGFVPEPSSATLLALSPLLLGGRRLRMRCSQRALAS